MEEPHGQPERGEIFPLQPGQGRSCTRDCAHYRWPHSPGECDSLNFCRIFFCSSASPSFPLESVSGIHSLSVNKFGLLWAHPWQRRNKKVPLLQAEVASPVQGTLRSALATEPFPPSTPRRGEGETLLSAEGGKRPAESGGSCSSRPAVWFGKAG